MDGLIFGIYPGGAAAAGSGEFTGPPDDPAQVAAALDRLAPPGRPFIIRGYTQYLGRGRRGWTVPPGVEQYVGAGRALDLVLCFRAPEEGGDFADWTAFIREIMARYAPYLGALQITEEPNSSGPGGDGCFANVKQALVRGVAAARDEALRRGYEFQIGCNATPSFAADTYWADLGKLGGADFAAALDYVGLDFFPDVFRPLPPSLDLAGAVRFVLQGYRQVSLPAAGIPPATPIRIGENGWPTSPQRSPERQAEVLETVVRMVYELRRTLNITHYTYFDLRDADSAYPEFGYQFGLMQDDYAPKPAFERYRRLIAELGQDGG